MLNLNFHITKITTTPDEVIDLDNTSQASQTKKQKTTDKGNNNHIDPITNYFHKTPRKLDSPSPRPILRSPMRQSSPPEPCAVVTRHHTHV